MPWAQSVFSLLAYCSLGFVVFEIYLTLNKLWSRKHDPRVVESISVMAKLVGLIPGTMFVLDAGMKREWTAASLDGLFWLFALVVELLIGMGLWVAGTRRRPLLVMLRRALAQERSELGDLLKALVRPMGADQIIDILGQLAYIDDDLDPREQELIQTFADHWQIPFDWQMIGANRFPAPSLRLQALSHAVSSYLAMSPPADQARQLGDLVSLIIRADGKVTTEEEIILAETTNHLHAYISDGDPNYCYVNIVPRSSEQATSLLSLVMNVEERQVAGASTYFVGPYFSSLYAEQIAKQYRGLGFFAIMVDQPGLDRLVAEQHSEVASLV
jgi:hypothetical protein